jgi:hypothetical protein
VIASTAVPLLGSAWMKMFAPYRVSRCGHQRSVAHVSRCWRPLCDDGCIRLSLPVPVSARFLSPVSSHPSIVCTALATYGLPPAVT